MENVQNWISFFCFLFFRVISCNNNKITEPKNQKLDSVFHLIFVWTDSVLFFTFTNERKREWMNDEWNVCKAKVDNLQNIIKKHHKSRSCFNLLCLFLLLLLLLLVLFTSLYLFEYKLCLWVTLRRKEVENCLNGVKEGK